MEAVIAIALPVFAVIAAGVFAGKRAILSDTDVNALNRFVFLFAMPAALFGLTATASPPSGEDLKIALAYGVSAALVMAFAYIQGKKFFALAPQAAGAHAYVATLGNAVFLGLPIALAVEGWAAHFVVLMLIEGVFVIAAGIVLTSPPDQSPGLGRLLRSFRTPIVSAMLAGIAYSAFIRPLGFSDPAPIFGFIEILGRAAGPTALFSLGLFFSTASMPSFSTIRMHIAAITALKLIVLPVLAIGGALALGVRDPMLLGPLSLFTLVPSGIGTYIVASQVGHYEKETVAAIGATTLLSLFTISAVLAYWSG
ncbi:MAG: AEC family transporter [Pseudomonadota bacterium]